MKKVYMAPQTEAIELLGTNAIMAGSGSNFNMMYGNGGDGGGMG